jgi:hypothetical protein
MTILMRHVDLEIPREGAGQLLFMAFNSMCPDQAIAPECSLLGLYLNDLIPTCETVFADLTIDDATLTPVTLCTDGDCTDNVEGPSLNPDEWNLIFDQQVWTLGADPGPVVAYGAVLLSPFGTGTKILGIKRFPTPLALATGDVVKLTATLPLLCNIAPVV